MIVFFATAQQMQWFLIFVKNKGCSVHALLHNPLYNQCYYAIYIYIYTDTTI